MANWHVLDRTQGTVRVAFHIPVPAGNNAVAVPWRTVIRTSGIGGKTILPDGNGTGGTIDTATEKIEILTNGTIYELIESYTVPVGLTLAQIGAELTNTWTQRSAELIDATSPGSLRWRLNYFGATG